MQHRVGLQMKHLLPKLFPLVIFCLFSQGSAANDAFSTFDEGQIANISSTSETRLKVVQTYPIERARRFELGVRYGYQYSGDVYSMSQGLGVNAGYNINQYVGVLLDYNQYVSKLTQEGTNLKNNDIPNRLPAGREFVIDVDSIKSSLHGSLVFYPMNGKLNLMDRKTLYFDPYISAGYGVVNTQRSSSNSIQATGGLSFYLTRGMSLKIENRFMTYETQGVAGKSRINSNQFGMMLGVLL